MKNEFSYFSSKTYVEGTQKNRLNETVLFEHPKHMLKLMSKKIITFLRSKMCISKPVLIIVCFCSHLMWEFYVRSLFRCVFLCVFPSLAINSLRKSKLGFTLCCGFWWFVSLPHSAMG